MKKMMLCVFLAMSVLVLAMASAQTVKCITPKQSDVNLRGRHEQNAHKVGTLAFGSHLQIVRKFNRWYEVQHNSDSAWVADWVVNEVACAGAALSHPAQSPSNEVDNCCFVDRQCRTDAEWTNGYWAFQNGHCGAPTSASVAPSGETAALIRAIDGDTIDVRLNGQTVRVRYIGVDTPERGEACYHEATNYNSGLMQGKTLTLVRDTSDYGPYGRLLRYVYADGVFVNLSLVQAGYAEASYYAPNGRHRGVFEEAQLTASRPACAGAIAQPQSSQTQIDNCCYINRQCASEDEWKAGYNAYQSNSACVGDAPALQSQQSSQSVTQHTGSCQATYVRNCSHARSLGCRNIPRGHPAYRRALDRDNDGIGCES